jgi:hypothetical protein
MDIKEDTEGNKYGAIVLGICLIYQLVTEMPNIIDKALFGIALTFFILNIIAIFKK